MKKHLLILIIGLTAFYAHAQTCSGTFEFYTQTSIDQFLIDNPTCTTIDGDVHINQSNILDTITWQYLDPISNLDGLQNITSITGHLTLGADTYSTPFSFAGLDQLLSVGGEVYLTGHFSEVIAFPNLVQADHIVLYELNTPYFNAFNALPHCAYFSPTLGTNIGIFDAFHSLQSCEYMFLDGSSVEQCLGFNQLESIGQIEAWSFYTPGAFWEFPLLSSLNRIYFTGTVNSFPDYPLVTEVNLGLVFSGYFQSIGFSGVESVSELIVACPELEAIHMNSLETIDGDFTFEMTNVSSLAFLSNLVYIGGEVSIAWNYQLTNCESQALCEKISMAPESVDINGNAPGCANIGEVGSSCMLHAITGQVYVDYDCDGAYNNNDTPVFYPVMLNDLNTPVGAGYMGGYIIPVENDMTISFSPASIVGLLPASPQTITTSNVSQTYTGVDFGLCPDQTMHDLGMLASIGASARPGFELTYMFYVQNSSANLEDGTVTFDFSNMPGVSVVNTYGGNISGNTVMYSASNLTAFEHRYFYLKLLTSAATLAGTVQSPLIMVSLDSSSDQNLSNNVYTWNQTVVSSYDPNDIAVNIVSQNFEELPSEGLTLDYTIRFQNTGTAAAEFVRITDIIEEDLNLGSIEILSSSHPYQLSFHENREVEWFFDNIQLPDSSTDLEGSQGYIHYRIKTIPVVDVDDVIENTAAIYFDFNEPIITNTATTVFYICPEQITVTGTTSICEGETAMLYASPGWTNYQWMLDGEVAGEQSMLSLEGLTEGLYSVHYMGSTQYCESMDMLELNVNGIPATPTITQSGNTLTATGNGTFTWTLNGEVLNDTDSSIEMTETGNYEVSYVNVCPSLSASGVFEFVGVNEWSRMATILIAPNPSTDFVNLTLPEHWIGRNELKVTDATGRLVVSEVITSSKTFLDASALQSGCYQISILNAQSGEAGLVKWMIE